MDDVLQLAGALGVDLQGVVQEKDLGKLDQVDEGDEDNPVDQVEEVDEYGLVDEDRDCETSTDWDEVEEVKLGEENSPHIYPPSREYRAQSTKARFRSGAYHLNIKTSEHAGLG